MQKTKSKFSRQYEPRSYDSRSNRSNTHSIDGSIPWLCGRRVRRSRNPQGRFYYRGLARSCNLTCGLHDRRWLARSCLRSSEACHSLLYLCFSAVQRANSRSFCGLKYLQQLSCQQGRPLDTPSTKTLHISKMRTCSSPSSSRDTSNWASECHSEQCEWHSIRHTKNNGFMANVPFNGTCYSIRTCTRSSQ